MPAILLTLNSGSSSLKFSIFLMENILQKIFYGEVDISTEILKFFVKNKEGKLLIEQVFPAPKKSEAAPALALEILLTWLEKINPDYHLAAAGHRIVHGGDFFKEAIRVTDAALDQMESLTPLAPLHQPHNIAGIKTLKNKIPDLFQVACFDTAFHTSQPEIAQAYALPENLSPLPIKRYGFHGLSYEYITQVAPTYLGEIPAQGKMIIAHLGQGASLCAVHKKQSIATTMGFSTLEGLPMGTRCGTIDPGIILYLLQLGKSPTDITEILYKKSGLLGVSELSSDVRVLLASEHFLAKKAIDLFVYRVQRELGSLVAALDGIDSLIFTAGIGEHSPEIRARICQVTWLSCVLNPEANQKNQTKISIETSPISVWVIPTDEELVIAQHTKRLAERKGFEPLIRG